MSDLLIENYSNLNLKIIFIEVQARVIFRMFTQKQAVVRFINTFSHPQNVRVATRSAMCSKTARVVTPHHRMDHIVLTHSLAAGCRSEGC